MKRIFLAIVLPALFFAGCNDRKSTVITGTVTGKANVESLVYSAPLSGTSYGWFRDSVNLDENGHFELRFEINKPVFIHIRNIDPHVSAKLLVEPGNNYHVAMDVSEKTTQLSGANEKGQMLYATLPDPSFIEMEARRLKLLQDSSLISIHNSIEALKQSDISAFEELFNNNEISKSFFELVKADRDCYYASLEARTYLIKAYDRLETKQFVLPSGENLLENLTKIYTQYAPNDERLLFSSFWSQFAEYYIRDYRLFIREDFDMDTLRKLHAQQLNNTFFVNEAKQCFTGKALEFYQATLIYFNAIQKDFQKELVSLYEQFIKDYPHSEYSKYLKPEIDEIIRYRQIIENPFDETVQFMDNYENITTLYEAIKPFRGKKIYIDVWATWCGPCQKEFAHLKELKKILAEHDIQQLYISIDKDERDEQWKNGIKFYGLSGVHIRANKELAMDLYKRFDKKAKTPYMNIPWYMLVDENGRIVNEHAKEPSQIIKDGFAFE